MRFTRFLCASLCTFAVLASFLCQALPTTRKGRRPHRRSRDVVDPSPMSPATGAVTEDPELSRWSCTLATRPQFYEGLSPLHAPVYSEETWCQDHLQDYTASDTTASPTLGGSDVRHSKITTCRGEEKCIPIVSVHREFNLYTGIRKKLTPHRCGCFSEAEPCRPIRHTQHFFPNTPFSKRIDTRRCMGSCTNGGSCRATKNHTVSIPGPNGAVCVTVIDECECTRSCHRSSYNMIFSEQVTDAETGEKTDREKVIDVGRCSGSCREQIVQDCIKEVNTTGPLLDLQRILCENEKTEHSCVPGSASMVNFTDTKGIEQSIPVIDTCVCKELRSGFIDLFDDIFV